MIEKRYQWLSNQGVKWTSWFPFRAGNTLRGQVLEKWQVKNKLANEYRVINDKK